MVDKTVLDLVVSLCFGYFWILYGVSAICMFSKNPIWYFVGAATITVGAACIVNAFVQFV
jgi:hypothetical protein